MAYYTSGSATDEQDLVNKIDTFVTGTLGWTAWDVVTDTASDNDRVYKVSRSGVRDVYVRFRGTTNIMNIYGYSLWVDSGTYSDEIFNSSYTKITVSSSPVSYWLFGMSDWVWIVVKDGSNYYSAYGGFLHSYYDNAGDDLPLAIVGMGSSTYTFQSNRCYMYSPTVSGTSNPYFAKDDVATLLLARGSPNTRDGSFAFVPLVMYSSTAGHEELRGELQGAYQANGTGLSSESWVTISGSSDKLFIIKHGGSATSTYGYGPVPV